MEELQNFRRFLNEEIMRGDTVVLKGDDTKMKVMSVRDMFASDLKAYVVKNKETGETMEYSGDQLQKVADDFYINTMYKEGKKDVEEMMYIDDEEFEMEMGRSKKDSLKKEMMIHVDQLLDGNIDMNDFINVVEDILSDLK